MDLLDEGMVPDDFISNCPKASTSPRRCFSQSRNEARGHPGPEWGFDPVYGKLRPQNPPIPFSFSLTANSARSRTLKTVLERARAHGLGLPVKYRGPGTCGQCFVTARPEDCLGPVSDPERFLLSPERLARGERLACQARLRGSGAIYSLGSDEIDVSFKTGISGAFPVDAAIDRLVIPRLELLADCGRPRRGGLLPRPFIIR